MDRVSLKWPLLFPHSATVILVLAGLGIPSTAIAPDGESRHDTRRDVITDTSAEDEIPVCFVYHQPGSQAKQLAHGGITFALWSDGVVLYAANPNKPGADLQIGGLREDADLMLDQLERDGVMRLEETLFIVPSSSYTKLVVRRNNETFVLVWDECIIRNYGANINPNESYRAFVRAWYMAKITIATTSIEPMRELADTDLVNGVFRGYNVAAPGRTSWLNVRQGD